MNFEQHLRGRGITAEIVLQAMRTVPREKYVLPSLRDMAYSDRPLPIDHGQTISQPYIVALMTDLAKVREDSIVLEVGTGSGYQAAILAEIARDVYTIEIIPGLANQAQNVLKTQGYENVHARAGDGYLGWPEAAPFDAIIVTAAPDHIPQPLIDQLKSGGRLIIPVGPVHSTQDLRVLVKQPDGSTISHSIIPVRFVPLTGDR
jgi:protein-L-isoaspartate(D-aspartate) O-methyltransferase